MNTTDHQTEIARLSAKIIGETIRARGTMVLFSEVAREMIDEWAKKGGIRNRLASPARWIVSKFLRPGGRGTVRGISADVGRLLTVVARKVNADQQKRPCLPYDDTRGRHP